MMVFCSYVCSCFLCLKHQLLCAVVFSWFCFCFTEVEFAFLSSLFYVGCCSVFVLELSSVGVSLLLPCSLFSCCLALSLFFALRLCWWLLLIIFLAGIVLMCFGSDGNSILVYCCCVLFHSLCFLSCYIHSILCVIEVLCFCIYHSIQNQSNSWVFCSFQSQPKS